MNVNDIGLWITEQIKDYLNNSLDNTMRLINEKAWGSPIIGFSNGADELYRAVKEDIFKIKQIFGYRGAI